MTESPRDMAAAPKDGSRILIWGTVYREVGSKDDAPDWHVGCWNGGTADYPGKDWWDMPDSSAYSVWIKPLAWLPLPAPIT